MNTPILDLAHFPRIVALAGGGLARVTRCDATDIAFDRVTALGTTPETYRVTAPAQAVPPVAGFDPATAAAWPTDAALVAAIDHPPAVPALRRQQTRTILDRLTAEEAAALTACTVPGIRLLVLKATAAGEIRDDDPDFPAAVAGLNALGIIATARWEALFAP